MNDTLGDRMKCYEACMSRQIPRGLPVIVRLDGKAFHTYTRPLVKPYDSGLNMLFVECTKILMKESGAIMGYTQSDELSLLLHYDDYRSQIYFDGKVDKLVSVLTSVLTANFNVMANTYIPACHSLAYFDARCFFVPTKIEAYNYFLWRERDATRNSKLNIGQYYFSHKNIQGKNTSEIQEMLFQEKNINWNDFPYYFKRGNYVQKRKVEEKSVYISEEVPPISRIANKMEFLFDGQIPVPLAETEQEAKV